mmetsp:Transcript_37323/g.36923  ORF Transcript_37323/g.36923 Transcript_37323/m.36923 type:complete len:251 (-) Transcript_37323:832-1584(-)
MEVLAIPKPEPHQPEQEVSQEHRKKRQKTTTVKLKLTDFRKEFHLSPSPKKSPNKLVSKDGNKLNSNVIKNGKKSQSMKFDSNKIPSHGQDKSNYFQGFKLSRIDESEKEAVDNEDGDYFKISENSVGFDTDAELDNDMKLSVQTQGSAENSIKKRPGSVNKITNIKSTFSQNKSPNNEKACRLITLKLEEFKQSTGAKPSKDSSSSEEYKESPKSKPRVVSKHSHIWLHNIKGNSMKVADTLKDLSPTK